MKKLIVMVLVMVLIMLVGCVSLEKQEDGSLGIKLGIGEKTHETIGKVGDSATGILGVLSSFFPALLPVAGAIGVGTVGWKKMKKTVTKYRSPMEMYVKVFENIKKTDKATWNKVKAHIKAEHPTVDVEKSVSEIKAELIRLKQLSTT